MPPQLPMPGRMGSQMMGSLFGGGRNPMMGMGGMRQLSRFPMMGGSQQMNGGGGLLSRLFSRGAPAGGMNPARGMNGLMGLQQAGRAAGGSGSAMGSIANPGGISSFLNNTQQVLKTAQSIGPMVQQFQQYGSLIRNLPAMWKLFQGLKNAPSDKEESDTASESESKTSSTKGKKGKAENSSNQKDESSPNYKQKKKSTASKGDKQVSGKQQTSKEKGASVPKLYI